MAEKISIRTISENDQPSLKVLLQTAHGKGAILSLTSINGSMLRLVALPEGESIVSLEKIQHNSIHVKIETGHYTLLRKIDLLQEGQEIVVSV